MAEMSNYLENVLINGTLRGTTYTAPAAVYVALFTSDPTDAGTGTECSGGGYARQTVTFASPSNGATVNSAAVEFPQATTNWGTIGWLGLYDAATSGNLLYHTALTTAKTIDTGDIFKFAASSISVTLS
ncbi:MAG: hypothetical protein NBV65_02150 [Burkholderiaceae bacterium]|nr:hypothetical protein [Burkholderiaceae bacterium]